MSKIVILALLIGIVLVSVLVYIFSSMGDRNSDTTEESVSIRSVDVTTFQKEIEEEGSILIDIRTPDEFESGHIDGATNIDFYSFSFRDQLLELDREGSYKIYCNSGNRTKSALGMMKSLEFKDITELRGGISSWASGGKPICTDC